MDVLKDKLKSSSKIKKSTFKTISIDYFFYPKNELLFYGTDVNLFI